MVGIGSLGHDREDEPALRLLGTWNHQAHYAFARRQPQLSPSAPSRSSTSPPPPRQEQLVYGYLRAQVALPLVYDDGESLLYARRAGKPLVLLAGHTDTVPAQGNLPGRIEGGSVHGLGASDMKGGLAVMMELGAFAPPAELDYDLALLFFPREEIGPDENPLPRALRGGAASSTRRRS